MNENSRAYQLLSDTIHTTDLPDISGLVERSNAKYIRPACRFDERPRLLLVSSDLSRLERITAFRDLSQADSSRNGAFMVEWVNYEGGKQELVVKPSKVSIALGEVAMSQYLGQRDLCPFPITGVLIDGTAESDAERTAWLISRYRPEATGLDRLVWHEMDSGTVRRYFKDSLLALSALHKVAIVHGDSFLRNFIQLDEGVSSSIQAIDFEHAVSVKNHLQSMEKIGVSTSLQRKVDRGLKNDLNELVSDICARSKPLCRSKSQTEKWLKSCLDVYCDDFSDAETTLKLAAERAAATVKDEL